MEKFNKYKQNLSLVREAGETFVKSYNTLVAKVDYQNSQMTQLGYWSVTTQKHINYAAKELSMDLIKL
tara:strand:- start:2386 stop:2589 length:204 start_codon:yes stop_codon:yes gene_type:complete